MLRHIFLFLACRPNLWWVCKHYTHAAEQYYYDALPANGLYLQNQRLNIINGMEKRCIACYGPNNVLNWKSHVYLFIVYGAQQQRRPYLFSCSFHYWQFRLQTAKPSSKMKKCNQFFLCAEDGASTKKNLSFAMEYTHTATELFNRWLCHGRSQFAWKFNLSSGLVIANMLL